MDYVLAFDICSAALLFFLFVSLFLRKATRGRSNKIFLLLVAVVFVSSVSDVFSMYIPKVARPSYENRLLVSSLNYIYFICRSLSLLIYALYIYASCGYWHDFRKKKNLRYPWMFFCAAEAVLIASNFFLGNIFYVDENLQYRRGSGILLFWLMSFIVSAYTASVIVRSRKFISRKNLVALLSIFVFIITGTAFQYFFPKLLIVNFCSAFPLLLITLVVQKPEEFTDSASGLPNFEAFKYELRKCYMTGGSAAVVLVKISNLSLIKKEFSAEIVKAILSSVARKISMLCVSQETEMYSIGEGFFCIVSTGQYEENNGGETFYAMAEGINLVIKETQKAGQTEVALEPKVCVARCPADLHDLDAAVKFVLNFDNVITRTGEVVFLSEEIFSRDFLIRANLDNIITDAITGKEFQMYYQPIYNIHKKKFTSAEALIRLIDKRYGFVSPGLFIPAAETSGAIHQIGDYVFDAVLKFVSRIDFDFLGLEFIELNLSVAQAIEDNLADKVARLMDKYGIPPSRINIEITETAADFNPLVFDRNIARLSSLGMSFSLDDYGTGYSNIKRMTELPLDIIKLDKSFADDWKLRKMNTVIRDTVSMLKEMDKSVLIEGVEDKEACGFFEELGCDYIQGFYFSKPLPEKDFIDFICANNGCIERGEMVC